MGWGLIMATLEIPVRTDLPNYNERVDLEGTTYIFKFRFNSRWQTWIMDILTADEDNILVGVPIHVNLPLISKIRDERLPQGFLFAINIENTYQDPTEDNFGQNVLLLYRESTT